LPKTWLIKVALLFQMALYTMEVWVWHYSIILRSTNSSCCCCLLVSNPYLSGNRYATNYYCCRYWNFYFGGKLLANLGMENIVFFWYLLNPLVLIELTEIYILKVLCFSFVWGMYLLQQNKWQLSALLIAFSISVKLLPLLLLPFF
jgi:hypothetical protein